MKPTDPSTCPDCNHETVFTTEYFAATRIDPEAWAGECSCGAPHRVRPPEESCEIASVCCGAPEHPDVENFCSACNDGTGFECIEHEDGECCECKWAS